MTAILPSIPLDSIEDQAELYRALEALRDELERKMQALLANTALTDINNTAATVSAGYVQAEVQQIADDVQVVSAKVDLILGTLRSAGILTV